MVSRRGRVFLLLVILLNVPFFFVMPWERILFDKEKVIAENSGDMVTVDMRELEPTGVYVWMEDDKPVSVENKRPNWFYSIFYSCTQFYVYSGDRVSEETRMFTMRDLEDDNPYPVLIADDVFTVPDSGKIELDLSTVNRVSMTITDNALEEVNKKFGLSDRRYIDCATPYSKALNEFRGKRITACVVTACVECLMIPILLLIIISVRRKKQQREG